MIVDRVHDMARPVLRAELPHPRMERVEQAQRIALAVERTVAGADDLRPDVRQALEERIAVQHLVGIADHVRLIVQALEQASAGLQLRLGERQGEAARPRERHVDARGLLELLREILPGVGGSLGPSRVVRHAQAFALDPDQREIGTGGAMGDIALVEHHDALMRARHAPGERRSDEAAADHCDIEICRHGANIGTPRRSVRSPGSRTPKPHP